MNDPDISPVAALAGEPARAAILSMLFDGRAIPAGELARGAGVSAATASAHLSKLTEGGLIRVRSQGRHRYYEIARPEIAQALEALGNIAPPSRIRSLGDSLRMQRLRFARSCYDHLAGEAALAIAQALLARGALETEDGGFRLTEAAPAVLLSAEVDARSLFRARRAHVRGCIDWTERRAHISGPLGAAMLGGFLESGVFKRRREPRSLELTAFGRDFLRRTLGIDFTPGETIAG